MRHRCSIDSFVCSPRFNPRTHTGCDIAAWADDYEHSVSIHAPTRGATIHAIHITRLNTVSIHAPTRGATALPGVGAYVWGVQSTHPHGVRHSIILVVTCGSRFNPRTHTGCDRYGPCGVRTKPFQSTHPHGVRLTAIFGPLKAMVFQSTHPHGVRLDLLGLARQKLQVSIHAPTRGATTIKQNAL